MAAGLAAKDFTFTSPLVPCAPRMAPISTSRCDVAEEDMALADPVLTERELQRPWQPRRPGPSRAPAPSPLACPAWSARGAPAPRTDRPCGRNTARDRSA